MNVNDRDRLWSASYAIIEGLKSKFGRWVGTAENIAYKNIYNVCPNCKAVSAPSSTVCWKCNAILDFRGMSDGEVTQVVSSLKELFSR